MARMARGRVEGLFLSFLTQLFSIISASNVHPAARDYSDGFGFAAVGLRPIGQSDSNGHVLALSVSIFPKALDLFCGKGVYHFKNKVCRREKRSWFWLANVAGRKRSVGQSIAACVEYQDRARCCGHPLFGRLL
jgi:hypothetical protein